MLHDNTLNFVAFHISQVVNITDEASKVLLAVCLLKNFPWSRENTTNPDALMAIEDAVVNNSCAWVMTIIMHFVCMDSLFTANTLTFQLSSSLHRPFSCNDLSTYCSATGMFNVLLYTMFKGSNPAPCEQWITNNLIGYSHDIRSTLSGYCL